MNTNINYTTSIDINYTTSIDINYPKNRNIKNDGQHYKKNIRV